ncbi:hypothetical protein O181_064501 [Austropuccinia psidii MF-1]|uniref:Reverse transcriptase RNase H-like domain-containing protein n=1 Tax=Austropuccinia psidii MF-1 TaxID=1389203 RepID=A0A9Q3I0C0_9BASI|nr:hypothetical protein [Austropuccinia psidii MF-1]
MDLPPSSYHDSLVELWDEEEDTEEVETVMMAFPSFYLQYLDIFSKVKAEDLPHYHACNHHIELQGSLPPEALSQFHQLKGASTTAGILSHFNSSLLTIVETNESNYALGAVLSQVFDSGKHPIAFDSNQHIPAELNYETHYKELLGIVWALKDWRAFLFPLSSPFEVLTNHSSLQYFMYSQLIKQDEVQPSRFFAVKVECFSNLIESIQKKLWQDPQYRSILQELGKGKFVQDYSPDSSSQLLLFNDWVVISNDFTIQLSILQKGQDPPLAGHPGQETTLKLVKWDSHWSGMTQLINDYIPSCQQCSRNKNIHHKMFVLLKPIPIPNGPWICLSIDFITQLPMSNSFESILARVDRFSKIGILFQQGLQ